MNQISIIADLITWIEKNLEQPLSIDHVAKRAGYSKWHLQRMFKEVTGQILGTYIRYRRLTYAALSLRLTSKPILEIAMQYRFDSQQTFTRSFKKQFNITPATYRRNEYWDPTGLTPPIELNKTQFVLPEPYFINMPEQCFWGITYKNNCNLRKLLDEKNLLRTQMFSNYLSRYSHKKDMVLPNKIYAFNKIKKNKVNTDDQELFYTIALEHNNGLDQIETYNNEGGLYLCFKYIGHPENFGEFISQIYLAALPALNVKIRPESVIEIHYNRAELVAEAIKNTQTMECDYCLPIINDDLTL